MCGFSSLIRLGIPGIPPCLIKISLKCQFNMLAKLASCEILKSGCLVHEEDQMSLDDNVYYRLNFSQFFKETVLFIPL